MQPYLSPRDAPEFLGVLGPTWPQGAPKGWPNLDEASDDAELSLEIEVPDNAADREILDTIADLVDKVDDLQRAYGGHGLQVTNLEAKGEVLTPVEVLQ